MSGYLLKQLDWSLHILLMQFYSSTPPPDLDEMAIALRSWGHTVWVATPNARGDMEWRDGDAVIAFQRGPAHLPDIVLRIRPLAMIATRLAFFLFMTRLRAFVRGSGADVVQVTPPQYACVMPLFMPTRMRFILDVRQAGEVAGDGVAGRLRNWKSRVSLRANARLFYDHACFATEAAARRILGDRWEQCATVHRVGQNERFLRFEHPDAEPNLREGTVRFIYLGTLSRVRSLELILSAVQWLLQKTNDFKVDFVGPDESEGFYHRLVQDWSLGSVVTVKPPVRYQDVPELVAGYDVAFAYVPPLPDWRYQPTLKILEYRALGIPIIATDNGPNRDVVEDGINGVLIQDSVESMGQAMLRFIADRDFLMRCQKNARSMRRGRTWSDSAKLYEQVVYMRRSNGSPVEAEEAERLEDSINGKRSR